VRIVFAGAGGQLGAAVVHECRTASPAHDVVALTRSDLDVADDAAVLATIERLRPDAIVNGAAYNDVDGAEDHPIDALTINAFAVRALARAARALDAVLVHFSTDFVFDGHASQPYAESDAPNPRSVYAASKLLGEWFAMDAPRAYVLRVESLFGRAPGGGPSKGSVAAIAAKLVEREVARVFEDRTVSPTYILDAARAVRHLVETAAPAGLYHCVNSGCGTWVELAEEIARQLGVEPRLQRIRMADLTLRADRPMYCALANDKLRAAGFDMPAWQDAVRRYVSALTRDPRQETARG
jgi:dTDP-4-dehydrorhamnose reductase